MKRLRIYGNAFRKNYRNLGTVPLSELLEITQSGIEDSGSQGDFGRKVAFLVKQEQEKSAAKAS